MLKALRGRKIPFSAAAVYDAAAAGFGLEP